MKRLVRAALLLMIGLGVILSAAVRITRAQNAPANDVFATGNCAQPCWQGVQVGQTTLTEARTAISADPRFRIISVVSIGEGLCTLAILSPARPLWQVCINGGTARDDDVVHRIDIYPDPSFRLGDAMLLYGTPLVLAMCLVGNPGFGQNYHIAEYLYFPGDIEVMVDLPAQPGGPASRPDYTVHLIRYHYPGQEPPYRFDTPLWAGFKSYSQGC